MAPRSRPPASAVLLLALSGCPGPSPLPEPEGVQPLGSFAILTDLHIGEGHDDYGTAGWDDSGGEEDDVTATLAAAVEKVNAAREAHDIRLAMVLGDLTDSGETSEFVMARDILEGLDVPWFPLLGNHDAWPYCRNGDDFSCAPEPSGDSSFEEVFAGRFGALADAFPSLELAPFPCDNPEHGIQSSFVNYAFDHEGWRFVVLDLNTRKTAGPEYPGVTGEADLHDFPGGTLPWFASELESSASGAGKDVLVFSHHPPLPTSLMALSDEEQEAFTEVVAQADPDGRVRGFFAGHWHLDVVNEVAFPGRPVVVTPATKDLAAARLVRLWSDGSVGFAEFLE